VAAGLWNVLYTYVFIYLFIYLCTVAVMVYHFDKICAVGPWPFSFHG